MSLSKFALPGNILDRLEDHKRRLDYLERYLAMPQADPASGEGAITYIEILKQLLEGPDIVLVDSGSNITVGRAGNEILLFDSGNAVLRDFAFTDAGLIAALATMDAGDVLWIPAGTISGGPWTLASGTLEGLGPDYGTILDGQLTVSDATAVKSLRIERSENQGAALVGVLEGAGAITAILDDLIINVTNAGGPAYCVEMQSGGYILATDCRLTAVGTGANGWAGYIIGSVFRGRGDKALYKGDTATYPFGP